MVVPLCVQVSVECWSVIKDGIAHTTREGTFGDVRVGRGRRDWVANWGVKMLLLVEMSVEQRLGVERKAANTT
jgi:hypothetical protein